MGLAPAGDARRSCGALAISRPVRSRQRRSGRRHRDSRVEVRWMDADAHARGPRVPAQASSATVHRRGRRARPRRASVTARRAPTRSASTERTPEARVREFMAGIDASVVVTGHVHVQLRPRRRWNPADRAREASGLPYEAGPGARLGAPRSRGRAAAHRIRRRGAPSRRCARRTIRASRRSSS